MTETLTCGHPASYLYRHPSVGQGCCACHRTPASIAKYVGILCGVEVAENDPPEMLQAIVADPDNSLPRLVFADWLDEQGDPRGELIRVEAELAAMNVTWIWDDCLTGLSNVTTNRIHVADELLTRRAALRRQLGYDQPADKYTPQFTIRESDLINPQFPEGQEVLDHIECIDRMQRMHRAMEARIGIPPTINTDAT